jgi:hypothetical protein
MKKLLVLLLPLVAAFPLSAKDLSVKTQAKIDITTNTSYGVNLDNPDQQGLRMDFSHFGISFNLANGGLVSNKIKSDGPSGFVQFEFGGLQLTWSNTSSLYDRDLNNPGKNTNTGFNAGDTGYTSPSQDRNTGYSYPVYIERFVSGIQWKAFDGEFVVQLAGGGDAPENWRPWSNVQRGYLTSEFIQRWAYLDTRVQYQRASVPAYLNNSKMSITGLPDDSNYWIDGNAADPQGYTRDLNLNPKGTLVGLQFNAADFSVMAKFSTEKTWADKNPTDHNGMAFGVDASVTPQALKGFKAYVSAGKEINYGTDSDPQPSALGGKVGWDFPLADPLTLEPYVGVQTKVWDKVGVSGTNTYANATEASAGLTLHWPGNGGWQWDNLEQRNGVLFPGLTVAYTIRDHNDLTPAGLSVGPNPIQSLRATLFEESGDYGLVPGLGAEMVVEDIDFLNNPQANTSSVKNSDSPNGMLLTTTYLDYTVSDLVPGDLIPWTRIYWDNFVSPNTGDRVNNLKVDLGVKLAKAVRNAVFGVDYLSRNLTSAVRDVNGSDLFNGAYGLGMVKAWVEVSL